MIKRRNLTIYGLFHDIINCFVISCGITLIINFFYYNEQVHKNIVKYEVACIFTLLLIITIIHKLFVEKPPVVHLPIGYGITSLKELSCKENIAIAKYNLNISIVHEAGHALMSYLKNIESFNVSVSYVSANVVSIFKDWDCEDVKNHILITYAGAVAEEIILGGIHFGCIGFSPTDEKRGDFYKAKDLLKAYIVIKDNSKSKTLLEEELSSEVITLSKEFYQQSKDIILQNKVQLDAIIEALKKNNSLTKKEIEKILESVNKI